MYTWGPILLASLYHDMHQVVYCEGRSIEAGVTLLHIWEYENIVVLRPLVVLVDIHEDEPIVFRYRVLTTLQHTRPIGLPYCHCVIDDMTVFRWRS